MVRINPLLHDEDVLLKLYACLVSDRPEQSRRAAEAAISEIPQREHHWEMGREQRFRRFHELLADSEERGPSDSKVPERSDTEQRFSQISERARAALLLIGIFGFDSTEASVVLRTSPVEARALLLQAFEEIDQKNPLRILLLEPHPDTASYIKEALHPFHHIDHIDSAALFQDAIARTPYDLIIAEAETQEELPVVSMIGDVIKAHSTPVLFFTGWPERLIETKLEVPFLMLWKPIFDRDELKSRVRHVAFWRTLDRVANPQIACAFGPPVEKDAAPPFIPEFQSRSLPRRLPPPFEWVRRDQFGRHIFLRPDDPRSRHSRFPDPCYRETYEEAKRLIDEIIATGRDEIILAALASIEDDVRSTALTAWDDDVGSDWRRHDRTESLYLTLREAYYALSSGEQKVRLRAKDYVADCAKLVAEDPKSLRGLEWRELEYLVEEVFSKLGFVAQATAGAGDGGVDVLLTYHVESDRRAIAIELKHWRSGKRVGKETVAALGRRVEDSHQTVGLLIATGGFAGNAADSLTPLQRRKVYLADDKYLGVICGLYVKALNGDWEKPSDLGDLLPPPISPE